MSDLPLQPHDEAPVFIIRNVDDYEGIQALLLKHAKAEANTAAWLILTAAHRAIAKYEAGRNET